MTQESGSHSLPREIEDNRNNKCLVLLLKFSAAMPNYNIDHGSQLGGRFRNSIIHDKSLILCCLTNSDPEIRKPDERNSERDDGNHQNDSSARSTRNLCLRTSRKSRSHFNIPVLSRGRIITWFPPSKFATLCPTRERMFQL